MGLWFRIADKDLHPVQVGYRKRYKEKGPLINLLCLEFCERLFCWLYALPVFAGKSVSSSGMPTSKAVAIREMLITEIFRSPRSTELM